MSQEITRWLTEIRTLQHQIAALRQERDQAYASSANWRQLYEAEAQQRRTDVEQLTVTVATLRAELDALRSQAASSNSDGYRTKISLDVAADLNTMEGVRAQLIASLEQCDRLQQALDQERASHAETRKTLTTALGETIDALKAENHTALVHQPTEHRALQRDNRA